MQTNSHKDRLPDRNRLRSAVKKPVKTSLRQPIADLRARVEIQIVLWDQELRDMRDRVDAIEEAVNTRIAALMNAPPASARSDLAEARAAALRADALAQHIYEHQLVTLHSAIEMQTSAWLEELSALRIPPEQFWEQVLHGDMKATWVRLSHLTDGSVEVWQGFGERVAQMLKSDNG